MWVLSRRREQAMWRYNRVMMPLGVRCQGTLAPARGWIDTGNVDEILLVCRKEG